MPSEVYHDKTDPRIFWLNNRPLFIHGVLGKGGFATVFKVEMLVPFGCKVGRDDNGGFIFDEKGLLGRERADKNISK